MGTRTKVLGPTHYRFRPDVARVVHLVEARFRRVRGNTYVDHPWPGWDNVSVDFWDAAGRGFPIARRTGYEVLDYLLTISKLPPLRHWIYRHGLWTSFGGSSWWPANDHSGRLRHVHVTFWK